MKSISLKSMSKDTNWKFSKGPPPHSHAGRFGMFTQSACLLRIRFIPTRIFLKCIAFCRAGASALYPLTLNLFAYPMDVICAKRFMLLKPSCHLLQLEE
jgi:hypothetical protein